MPSLGRVISNLQATIAKIELSLRAATQKTITLSRSNEILTKEVGHLERELELERQFLPLIHNTFINDRQV